MVIAICGRDGAGKSTLCDALGTLFSKKNVCIVVDTDLIQPTQPSRCHGEAQSGMKSLGQALAGAAVADIRPYLRRHPRHKGLFYAGLVDDDDYLSYELGLERQDAAHAFIDRCAEQADAVILDLSGQRTDPFLPPALLNADCSVLTIVPDAQGLCWYLSVKPLLENMGVLERMIPIASMVQPFHDIPRFEKMAGFSFKGTFPTLKTVAALRDTDEDAGSVARYAKPLRVLHSLLIGGGSDA